MSSESNAGGGNARNDRGVCASGDQHGPDNDNSMVEYRVLDGSPFTVPDNHTNRVANRYRGAKDDLNYEQLAGAGAIEILDDGTNEPKPVEIESFRDSGRGVWVGEEISDDWQYVRTLYDGEESDDKAREQAVDQLGGTQHQHGDGDFEFVALPDSDELYCYNPTAGIYEPDGEEVVGKVLDKTIGSNYSIHEKREIVARLRDRHGVDRGDLGGPDGYVCVKNGVLELSDGTNPTLRGHDPRYGFTTRLNVPYKPEATCPRFKEFLGEVCRPEDIEKLQQYAGYCLNTWGQPYKKALVILGPTDAGKGVFLRILREIIGDENVATETLYSINSTRWGKAHLYGKVVNIANELAESGLKNAETFKTVTGGGDQITAERKGEDKFTFTPFAKHVFATNQVPDVDDASEAFYNRWLFVTFPNSVPPAEQQEDLDKEIVSNEAAGILNWMIEGYERLQQQGRFTSERSLGDKEELWADYGDSTDRFISQCLDITKSGDDVIAKSDAYAAYTAFCDDRGMVPDDPGPVTKALQREGVQQGQSRTVEAKTSNKSRVRTYRGVTLTEDGEAYLDASVGGNEENDDTRRDGDVRRYE